MRWTRRLAKSVSNVNSKSLIYFHFASPLLFCQVPPFFFFWNCWCIACTLLSWNFLDYKHSHPYPSITLFSFRLVIEGCTSLAPSISLVILHSGKTRGARCAGGVCLWSYWQSRFRLGINCKVCHGSCTPQSEENFQHKCTYTLTSFSFNWMPNMMAVDWRLDMHSKDSVETLAWRYGKKGMKLIGSEGAMNATKETLVSVSMSSLKDKSNEPFLHLSLRGTNRRKNQGYVW